MELKTGFACAAWLLEKARGYLYFHFESPPLRLV
jgi:hypothetical protein